MFVLGVPWIMPPLLCGCYALGSGGSPSVNLIATVNKATVHSSVP